MEAYIRSVRDGRFCLIEGHPDKQKNEVNIIEVFTTRRQAMRYAKAYGYNVIIKDKSKAPTIETEFLGKGLHEMENALRLRLSGRDDYENERDNGVWLNLPATADELGEVLEQIGAAGGEHGMDYFITNFESAMPVLNSQPIEYIRRLNIDELNHIAGQIEMTPQDELGRMNDTLEEISNNGDIRRMADARKVNESIQYIHDVLSFEQLGEYYLNNGVIDIPDELRSAVNISLLGELAARRENGVFTDEGYVFISNNNLEPLDLIPPEYLIEQSAMEMVSAVMDAAPERMYDGPAPAESNLKAANPSMVQRSANRAVSAGADQSKRPRPDYPATKSEKAKVDEYGEHRKTLKMLENGIKGIYETDKYKEFLDTVSKFHNYSYGNCVLIARQLPHATYVAGEKFWRSEMRRVPINQDRIRIIAPDNEKSSQYVEKTGADGKKYKQKVEVIIPKYKTVEVLDVSQTHGELMPKLTNDLYGNVERYDELFDALTRMSPVPINIESIKGNTKGYFDQFAKLIVIKDGMSEVQEIKTAIHEIAHARLHDINRLIEDKSKLPDDMTREVQAESIAYTVCQHYGIDSSDYSFGYIAEWSKNKDLPELKSSLGLIRREVNSIVNEIDSKLKEIEKEYVRAADAKEEIIQEILTEMKRSEPDFNIKVISDIENSMREMTAEELRNSEYSTYLPDKSAYIRPEIAAEKSEINEKQQKTATKSNETADKDSGKAVTKTPSKTSKTAKKAPAKAASRNTPAKTGIRAELAAAKKQAAERKPANREKSVSIEM